MVIELVCRLHHHSYLTMYDYMTTVRMITSSHHSSLVFLSWSREDVEDITDDSDMMISLQ